MTKWCDECVHFNRWHGKETTPDDYKVCKKGRKPMFREPRNATDQQWGYFLPKCADWERIALTDTPLAPGPETPA